MVKLSKPKLSDLVNLLIIALPIGAWIEGLVRGSGASLWLRDWLLSSLATLSFLIVFLNVISSHGYLWVLALIAIICALHGLRVARRPHFIRKFLRATVWTIFLFWKYTAIIFTLAGWWVLAIKVPGWTSLIALCWLAVYLEFRTLKFVRRSIAGLIGLTSLLLCLLLQVHDYCGASPTKPKNIFGRCGTYDIVDNGRGLFVVALRARFARSLQPNAEWSLLEKTDSPQRMTVDRLTGDILLANYGGGWITVFDGTNIETIRTCPEPVDIAIDQDRRRMYVACERIGVMPVYDLDGEHELIETRDSQILSVSLSLDQKRHRLYATSEILWGALEAFDLDSDSHSVIYPGLLVWGVAVDELTGNVWVARPLAGLLEVYDPQLHKLASVRVGTSPRDLAIDPQRRVLLAGNYFSGTVAVVDLDQMRLVRRLRVGRYSPLPLLTGVYVGTDGWWYAADRHGVWRIRPSLPPEPDADCWPPEMSPVPELVL
ncbi:MAG: hypothetical protein P9M14_07015 [Candidatus Alcyoniella australis]|nr:hypothetical protein [Candidatus Alcyoniella australis]